MSLKFSEIKSWKIPEGEVTNAKVKKTGDQLWDKIRYRYTSFGDSIAAGQRIREDEILIEPKCYSWQFGTDGVSSTTVIDGSYTDLIRAELGNAHGAGYSYATSFARSGDAVAHLMDKLDDPRVIKELKRSKLVTICIGANDILGCVSKDRLYEYAMTGSLSSIENDVNVNLNNLNTDDHQSSYRKLLEKLTSTNPDARYSFTTVYNPYKYLHLDEGQNGFFKELLSVIPSIPIDVDEVIENMFGISDLGYFDVTQWKWVSIELGVDLGSIIRDSILSTPIFSDVVSRINYIGGTNGWVEPRINSLNDILRSKINAYKSVNPNFYLAESKAEFDKYPDRTGTPVNGLHYNDLVNVEFTSGFALSQADWGNLWRDRYGDNVSQYWYDLAWKHTTWSNALPSTNVSDYVSFDTTGFAEDLMGQILEKVILPDIDPHPEADGHRVLKSAFDSAFGNDYTK